MLEKREGSGTFKHLAAPYLQLCLLGFMVLAPSCGTARAARTARADRMDRTALGIAATDAHSSPGLSDAAGELLALRRTQSALMAELTAPGPRSFDAIAAELAEVDRQYARTLTGDARVSPELARVVAASSPDDQDQRLLAVTSGLLKVATSADVQ